MTTKRKRTTRSTTQATKAKASSSTVVIRGRISTTDLRAGEIVEVELTDHIKALLADGYVEQVG